jgi:allantoate deiminase
MDAATVLERCARLGEISEEPGLLLRRYATPAMGEANELVGGWMRAAGMTVRTDAAGNLVGRREGAEPGARAFVLGSHLDTVRDAGRYDGPLGVIAGLAVVERLGGARLPFAVEVVGFADEEGTRFDTNFLGSRAWAGTWDPEWNELADDEGVTLADALRRFGGDPDGIAAAVRDPAELLGYCELHMEQGPVLEAAGEPVGVVTAIIGQMHARARFVGAAGHAGTVPMEARHDALVAAAEWIVAVEALARSRDGLVATVGRVAVHPGGGNVIPGLVELSLDLRHGDDAVRHAAEADLRERAGAIAAARGVGLEWEKRGGIAAVPMDPELTERLVAAGAPVRLPSGAGHDAATMARLVPAAMLFVRCLGGISHNPAEHVEEADVAVALDVLERFVVGLA